MTSPAPGWHITGVTPEMSLEGNRTPVEGFRVDFSMDNGVNGHIFVSRTEAANKELVRAKVNSAAAMLHDIRSLTSN